MKLKGSIMYTEHCEVTAVLHAIYKHSALFLHLFHSKSQALKKKQPADFVCLFTGLQTVGIFRVGSSKKRVRQVSENEVYVILSVSLDISLNY